MSLSRREKTSTAIALFALMIGSAGFFNTFDISSGRIRTIPPICDLASPQNCPVVPDVPYPFFGGQGSLGGTAGTVGPNTNTYIQLGSASITIAASTLTATAAVTFSPAFSSAPTVFEDILGNPGVTALAPQTLIPFFAVDNNSTIPISDNETQATFTIPNADTILTKYSLALNGYSKVIVEGEGYISSVALSTNQIINIKIKSGSTQQGQTMKVDAAVSATSSIPFSIKAAFVQTSAATLAITVGAAAADANTNIFLNSMRVYAVSAWDIWQSMPSASTEIFGSTGHRLSITPESTVTTTSVFIEMTCGLGSNTSGANLQLQYSTNGGSSWTNIGGTIVVDQTAGKCNASSGTTLSGTSATLASAAYLFRIVGAGGGGAGDNPVFSAMYLGLNYQSGLTLQHDHESVTASGVTLRVSRGVSTSSSLVVTLNWVAHLPPPNPSAVTVGDQGDWISFPALTAEMQFGNHGTFWEVPIKLMASIKTARVFATVTSPAIWGGAIDTTARLWIQYSADSGLSWHDLCGDNTQNPNVDITVTGLKFSSYCTIQLGAFGPDLLRVVGDGGDDFTTAIFNVIGIVFSSS